MARVELKCISGLVLELIMPFVWRFGLTDSTVRKGLTPFVASCAQVTPSFKSLVSRNPDLCLNFIKEVSLHLSIPSLPEPTDPDGNPLEEEEEEEGLEAGFLLKGTSAFQHSYSNAGTVCTLTGVEIK